LRSNRWFILAVLFVTRFCLGYQFQSAGSVAPFLISEFALDYRQIGTLVGLFMLPGLVFAPGGLLGKRFGDKPVVMMGMAAMIVGGLLSGGAQSYFVISVGRLISGLGAVFLVVLMAKMVTDWFAGKELFLGMAIFIIGWPVGIAAAQATQARLAEAEGWSAVFFLSAIMMTLALASVAAFYRDAPAGGDVSTSRTTRLDRDELWLVCIAVPLDVHQWCQRGHAQLRTNPRCRAGTFRRPSHSSRKRMAGLLLTASAPAVSIILKVRPVLLRRKPKRLRERSIRSACVRRLRAKPDKTFVHVQAAMPSS